MERKELKNGKVRLTAPNGITDTRNGRWFSVVICKAEDVDYFIAAE